MYINMKKLLFAAYNLDLGGIETSLVTLTNFLLEKGYEITIALEKKENLKNCIVNLQIENDSQIIH